MLNFICEQYCRTASDINEHLPVLRDRARECGAVVQIGSGQLTATWAFLDGLTQSTAKQKSYVIFDDKQCDILKLKLAQTCAHHHDIGFGYMIENELKMTAPQCDLLFIDGLHTYPHVTAQLEHCHSAVGKYIILHDTSAPWGHQDEALTTSEQRRMYPTCVDYRKQGLWPAVQDFLTRHPEWMLQERRLNNHGLTTLKRIVSATPSESRG